MNTAKQTIPLAKRVLVVEDVQIIQRMMRLQLGNLGCEVVIAKTGAEALTQASQPFDLILMDLHLPDMNGYDIIKQFHANPEHDDSIPIIIATTERYPNADDLIQVAELISGYHTKPLSVELLAGLLSKLN